MKKNRTKFLSMVICLLLATLSAFGTVGCRYEVKEEIDHTKTQLEIATYGGGYGTAFLDDLEARFEDWALKNKKSYEDGKVGVQIMKSVSKDKYKASVLVETIGGDIGEVYFVSGDALHTFMANNSLKDITTAITSPNQFNPNGESIASYLRPEMEDHHNVGTADAPKYYSLPFVEGGSGLTYDVDVFEKHSLYFLKGGCPSEYCEFVQENNPGAEEGEFTNYVFTNGLSQPRSAGPDGLYDTADDGLPATLREFEELISQMATVGIESLIWSGQYETEYSPFLARSFSNKHHGFAEASISKDAGGENGRATTIIEGFDGDGNPIKKEGHVITVDNIADVVKQEGYYYGLKMFETMLQSGTVSSAVDEGLSHVSTQYRYVFSNPDDMWKDIAFILDGVWWENEADAAAIFTDCARRFGEDTSRANRRFAYYPLPWVDESKIGGKNTMAGGGSSFFVANRVPDSKMELINDFVQFAYSYESLQRMTVNVGIPVPFLYDMNAINPDNGKTYYDSMSHFTRSYYDMYKDADIIYGFIDPSLSAALANVNNTITYMSSRNPSNKAYLSFPSENTKTGGATAEEFFLGLYRRATSK